MAEFQDVMRQWNRMCGKQRQCYTCTAYGLCSPVSDLCTDVETITALEGAIMRWAEVHPEEQPEEHPEPVYPTWQEWFETFDEGIDVDDPIPADIAQKLGIEPKEDT